jgi:hypothetical protein
MEKGHVRIANIGETAIQPPLRSVFVGVFTKKLLAAMHVIRAECDAGFPRDEDWSFTVRTTPFREQCRSDRRTGVHGYLWVESEGCRTRKK